MCILVYPYLAKTQGYINQLFLDTCDVIINSSTSDPLFFEYCPYDTSVYLATINGELYKINSLMLKHKYYLNQFYFDVFFVAKIKNRCNFFTVIQDKNNSLINSLKFQDSVNLEIENTHQIKDYNFSIFKLIRDDLFIASDFSNNIFLLKFDTNSNKISIVDSLKIEGKVIDLITDKKNTILIQNGKNKLFVIELTNLQTIKILYENSISSSKEFAKLLAYNDGSFYISNGDNILILKEDKTSKTFFLSKLDIEFNDYKNTNFTSMIVYNSQYKLLLSSNFCVFILKNDKVVSLIKIETSSVFNYLYGESPKGVNSYFSTELFVFNNIIFIKDNWGSLFCKKIYWQEFGKPDGKK